MGWMATCQFLRLHHFRNPAQHEAKGYVVADGTPEPHLWLFFRLQTWIDCKTVRKPACHPLSQADERNGNSCSEEQEQPKD
ncbi:hypothetical protein scyTo_0015031 [Scyliorhinus torazame]|uniref:Uncharacterized protein n=1 Tax=Scyliorhinus torazame TaxID=75743 RepID=A0A401P0L0_SCYTO|nr:hypothetical protein [Scyliorhinus torazame]